MPSQLVLEFRSYEGEVKSIGVHEFMRYYIVEESQNQYESKDTHSETIDIRIAWVLNKHRFLLRLWYRGEYTHIDFLNNFWMQRQYPPLLVLFRRR